MMAILIVLLLLLLPLTVNSIFIIIAIFYPSVFSFLLHLPLSSLYPLLLSHLSIIQLHYPYHYCYHRHHYLCNCQCYFLIIMIIIITFTNHHYHLHYHYRCSYFHHYHLYQFSLSDSHYHWQPQHHCHHRSTRQCFYYLTFFIILSFVLPLFVAFHFVWSFSVS